MVDKSQVQILKQTARESMKANNHTEAFFHLTHALKLAPDDTQLLSDRSKCLLQTQQYYLALEDANNIIGINPDSSTGHVRRAEICFATFNFDDALQSFQKAFQCSDSDKSLAMEWMTKCRREMARDVHNDKQFPWVGAAVGIIGSSLLLVLNYLVNNASSRSGGEDKPGGGGWLEEPGGEGWLDHPLVLVTVVVATAAASHWLARVYRNSVKKTRKSLLEPPVDLLADLHLD